MVVTLLVTLHVLVYWSRWDDPDVAGGSIRVNMFNHDVPALRSRMRNGFAAWVAMLLLVLLSADVLRRNMWEFFRLAHVVLFVVYIVCGLYYHVRGRLRWIFWVFVGTYLLDKAARVFMGGFTPVQTTKLRVKGTEMLELRFPKSGLSKAFFHPASYVYLTLPAVSACQAHPFSITSSPREPDVQVHIRALGDWTRRTLRLAAEQAAAGGSLTVLCNGPCGGHVGWQRYPVLLLAGGGIGFAPILSLLKMIYLEADHVSDDDRHQAMYVFPGKFQQEHAAVQHETDVDAVVLGGPDSGQPMPPPREWRNVQHVYVAWGIKRLSQAEYFAAGLQKVLAAAQPNNSRPALHLSLFCEDMMSLTAEESDLSFTKGYPDMTRLFAGIRQEHAGMPLYAFVCGPQPMIVAAWDQAVRTMRLGQRVSFHQENFDF